MTGALQLEPATAAGFACTPSYEDGQLSVAFDGTGDVAAIETLADYLKRLHTEALRLGVAEVRCDFRKLSFMNSSCFKSFVVWIDNVKGLPNPYKIRFVTDPDVHWQRRSLEALRRLATGVVVLETG
jgi:hypothetical protein